MEATLKQNKVFIDRLSFGINSEIELSDAACNHCTGFPTNERLSAVYQRLSAVYQRLSAVYERLSAVYERLSAVYEFLNPGINGENIIMYDNQVKERFSGGAARAMFTIYLFIKA